MESKFNIKPLGFRKRIPLYYPKTEEEMKVDRYEQYDYVVLKSVRNYYNSDFGEQMLSFCMSNIMSVYGDRKIVEIGCGGGFILGSLAEQYSNDDFIGFDYSYQMLRIAEELWVNGDNKTSEFIFPHSKSGLRAVNVARKSIGNVEFGLSKADLIPILDVTVDVVYSCFLWDRVFDIDAFIKEQKRMLKAGGRMIICTPLNYLSRTQWEDWYPVDKLIAKIAKFGFTLLAEDQWEERELLDGHGNGLLWKVLGLVWEKNWV